MYNGYIYIYCIYQYLSYKDTIYGKYRIYEYNDINQLIGHVILLEEMKHAHARPGPDPLSLAEIPLPYHTTPPAVDHM